MESIGRVPPSPRAECACGAECGAECRAKGEKRSGRRASKKQFADSRCCGNRVWAKSNERLANAVDQSSSFIPVRYAERSIDSVSLNEITVAAGQKNRNALQYHFGNRDGLLQAIIDKHALPASELRRRHLAALSGSGCSYAHAAAQAPPV